MGYTDYGFDELARCLPFLSGEAPRYTSYPPANHFLAASGTSFSDFVDITKTYENASIYLHIPFCPKLCWFCGCHTKATLRYKPVKEYVDLLIKEINLFGRQLRCKPSIRNIHFGGGSPTILNPEDLTRIFYAIETVADIQQNAEISIEIDPRQINKEKCLAYAKLGFNRASIGVQDFNTRVQEAINRVQPYELVLETFYMLRELGINNINTDLIYGLPFQTEREVIATAIKILELNPARIAYFSYAHIPWAKKHQRLVPVESLPDTKGKATQYLSIKNIFEHNDYKVIGIDHFARKEDDLYKGYLSGKMRRNFMGYSNFANNNIFGFGVSAVSESDYGLFQNTTRIDEYKKSLESEVLPIKKGWRYSKDDFIRKEVIDQLMCYFQVDLDSILQKHNFAGDYFSSELSNLKAFSDLGIISIENKLIKFQSDFRMLVRNVCKVFDQYTSDHSKRYSKIA